MKLRLVVMAALLMGMHHVLSENDPDGEFSSNLETVRDPTVRTAYIIGAMGGALGWSNYEVLFGVFESLEDWPVWLIYSNGTISPQEKPDRCVSYDYDDTKIVILETCGLLPRAESWLFTANDTILNQKKNLVMDVIFTGEPELMKVRLSEPSGAATQKFRLHEIS